jgi:ABC-type transport system substrate-binding protein
MSWAFERNVFDFRYDPAEAGRLLDAAGYRDPDGGGPEPRFGLSLKTST